MREGVEEERRESKKKKKKKKKKKQKKKKKKKKKKKRKKKKKKKKKKVKGMGNRGGSRGPKASRTLAARPLFSSHLKLTGCGL